MRDPLPRKKLSQGHLPRPASGRTPPAPVAAATARPLYAAILARARAAGLFALCTIAPLGALAGTVSACGAAMPVQPTPMPATDPNAQVAPPTGAGTQPAPLGSIAPPATNPPVAPE